MPLPTAEELRDLESQLSKGGMDAHELEKAKKKLEQEKEELMQSLEVYTHTIIIGMYNL